MKKSIVTSIIGQFRRTKKIPYINEPNYTHHNQKLFKKHKDWLKESFTNNLTKDLTYKQRTSILKWKFGDVGDVHQSSVQRICNNELNITHKVATKMLGGSTCKLTLMKRKICLYMLA